MYVNDIESQNTYKVHNLKNKKAPIRATESSKCQYNFMRALKFDLLLFSQRN